MTTSALTFDTEQSPWWLILIGGVLNIVIGLLLLTSPAKTAVVLAFALGLYWLFQGIVTLVGMFMDHTAWGWKLFIGLLSVVAGFIVMRSPLAGALTVTAVIILFLGIQGLVSGVLLLVLAFKGGGWGSGILGALSLIFGLVLIFNFTSPAMIVSLVWVAAIFALVGGIFQVFRSFQQRAA
jgi:uncharacterized membrane protein HdeD (DUF308 family)